MRSSFIVLLAALTGLGGSSVALAGEPTATRVHSLKITILSTMLADRKELGEWGFSALVEVDSHRLLVDTGAHSDLVLKNAQSLGIDLTTIPEVVLTHNHWDHVGGLLTLRDAVRTHAAGALSRVHVGRGIFYPRVSLSPGIEDNPALILKSSYEQSGGEFVEHDHPVELYPGVWLTGPVPRQYPERNWSGSGKMKTPRGIEEDNVPEDQAVVFDTDRGLVVLFGCGHAGVINTLTYAREFVRPARIYALIGGIHIFSASEETLNWTAKQLNAFGVDNLLGAHCTGIEPVYRFRTALGLDRSHAVVAAVGASFDLAREIDPGVIAK